MKKIFNMKVAILIAITIAFMEMGVIIYNNSMDQYIHKIVFDLGFILILANIIEINGGLTNHEQIKIHII